MTRNNQIATIRKGGAFGFQEIIKLTHFIGFFGKIAFRNKFSNKNISMFSIMQGKKKLNTDYLEDFNTLVNMLVKKLV